MKKFSFLAALLLSSMQFVAQNNSMFSFPFVKNKASTEKSEEVKRQMLPPALVRTAEGTVRMRTQGVQRSVALPLQGEVTFSQNFTRKPYKTFYKYDANQNITEYYEQYVEELRPKYSLKYEYKTLTEGEYAGRVVTTHKEEINYDNNNGYRTISTCDNKGMPLLEENYSFDGGWVKDGSVETVVDGNGVRTGVKIEGAMVSKALFDPLGRTQEVRYTQEGKSRFIQVAWGDDGLPSEIITNTLGMDLPDGYAYKIESKEWVRKNKNLNIWSLFPAQEVMSYDGNANINDRTLIGIKITAIDVESGAHFMDMGSSSYTYDQANRRIVETLVSNESSDVTEFLLEVDGKGYVSIKDAEDGTSKRYEYYRYNAEGMLVDDYYQVKRNVDNEIRYVGGALFEYTMGQPSRLADKKSYFLNYNNGTMGKTLQSTETYNYTPWTKPPFVFEEKNLSITIQGQGICQLGRNKIKITGSYSGKVGKGSNIELFLYPKMNAQFKSIKVNGVDRTSDVIFMGVLEKALRLLNISADQTVVIEFEPMAGSRHDVKVLIEGDGKVFVDDVEMSNNTVIQVADNGFIPYAIEEKRDGRFELLSYLQQLSFAGKEIDLEDYAQNRYLMPITQGGDMKFVFMPNIETLNTIAYVGETPRQGMIESSTSDVEIDDQNRFSVKSATDFRLRYNAYLDPTLVLSKMEINGVDVTEKYLFGDNLLPLKGMLTKPTNTLAFTVEKIQGSNPTISIYQPYSDELRVLLNNEEHGFYATEETFQFQNLEKSFRGWGVYLLFPRFMFDTNSQQVTGLKVDKVDRVSELRTERINGQVSTCLLLRELSNASTIQIYYDGVTNIKNLEIDATVYVQGSQLCVEGLEESCFIELFNGNGQLLESRTSISRNERFVLPSKGLYLLKIGDAVCKVQH